MYINAGELPPVNLAGVPMEVFKGGPASSSAIFCEHKMGTNFVGVSVEMSPRKLATEVSWAKSLMHVLNTRPNILLQDFSQRAPTKPPERQVLCTK